MKRSPLLFVIFIFASELAGAKSPSNESLMQIRRLQSQLSHTRTSASKALQSAQWIIGADDPNQVVEITSPMRYDGDILIVNHGRLIVRQTSFALKGDLNIFGNGAATFVNASFEIEQNYSYEHQAILLQQGRLSMDHVEFQSSGHSWSVGLTGESSYQLLHSTIKNGFITTAAFESAKINVEHTKTAGEFLCFGENHARFSRSELVLFWLVIPNSGIVRTSLPEDSLLVHWRFPDESAPG